MSLSTVGWAVTSRATISSPAVALNTILTDARAQQSVHSSATISAGSNTVSFIDDVGRAGGIQRISIISGHSTGSVTVIVIHGVAYFLGDSFALSRFMGFPAKTAQSLASRWIRVPSTNKAYGAIAADVTLTSVVNDLTPSGPLALIQATIGGRRVIGVTGRVVINKSESVPITLYATATATPLPVEEISPFGATSEHVYFSRWNERMSMPIPRHWVAMPMISSS